MLFSETDIQIVWDKIYGDFALYKPLNMVPTLDNGFILAGTFTLNHSNLKDIWVLNQKKNKTYIKNLLNLNPQLQL